MLHSPDYYNYVVYARVATVRKITWTEFKAFFLESIPHEGFR